MNFHEFVNHQEDMDFFHRFLHTCPLNPALRLPKLSQVAPVYQVVRVN
jgi:hypothetical protein